MEEDYLILECPGCERSIKARKETVGSRMGCPYCKEPIEVVDPEDVVDLDDDVEVGLEEPIQPLDFRKIQTAETGGAAASESERERRSEHGGSQSSSGAGSGERRKHRKRSGNRLDWDEKGDRSSADQDSEADQADSSEFLEMDPNSPGGVRLKKVRRKKILSKKEKFVRGLTMLVFGAAAAIAAVIAYTAIVQTSNVVGTDNEVMKENSEEVANAKQETMIDESLVSEQLTQEDEVLAATVLSDFLNATSHEERMKLVRNPEEMGPVMEKWYAENPEEATKEWPDADILLRKKILDQNRHFIIFAVEFFGEGQRVVALEQVSDTEIRIDWPTTVGYQPIPLADFKDTKPREPVKFWVKVKPSTFYSFGFSDPERYQAVELSYPSRIDFKLIGYIDRSKEWAAGLLTKLEEGQSPSLIVELQYPEGDIRDPSQVEVVSIVEDTWWP